MTHQTPGTTNPAASSPILLMLAWAIVVLPTAWGLKHTVQSALKLFQAPAPAMQATPAATSSRS